MEKQPRDPSTAHPRNRGATSPVVKRKLVGGVDPAPLVAAIEALEQTRKRLADQVQRQRETIERVEAQLARQSAELETLRQLRSDVDPDLALERAREAQVLEPAPPPPTRAVGRGPGRPPVPPHAVLPPRSAPAPRREDAGARLRLVEPDAGSTREDDGQQGTPRQEGQHTPRPPSVAPRLATDDNDEGHPDG